MAYLKYFFLLIFYFSFTWMCQASESFLFVGDSLSSGSAFADILVERFGNWESFCGDSKSNTTSNNSYALPSASPRHFVERSGSNKDWLCSQKRIYRNSTSLDMTGSQICQNTSGLSVFNKIVNQHKPTTYAMVLGTNSFAFSASYLEARIHEMLDQMSPESRCFWVTPTYVSSKYEKKSQDTTKTIVNALNRHPKKCLAIESFEEMKKQVQCNHFLVSDGIHHTRCGSQLWGEVVTQKICDQWLD